MESIIRNVDEIEANDRRALEHVLGVALSEHQQIIVQLVDLEPTTTSSDSDSALDRAFAIAEEGRKHAAKSGVSVKEAEQAIDEAIDDVRKHPQS